MEFVPLDMVIYIPTKGRVGQQLTLMNLPQELHEHVILCCPLSEVLKHQNNHAKIMIMDQPDEKMGIAEKRKWILENTKASKIVMLDDDLRFAVRRTDDPGLFRKAEKGDITQAFQELDTILSEEIPHAGFSARGSGIGDAAKRGGWQQGKRMMYVLGYHVPTVKKNAILGRISTHEDMDVCLQLLTQGYPNSVNFSFVVDQKFGNAGGCTNERIVEQNDADSWQLCVWFPAYVEAKEKEYKGSVNRVEVVCQWAKALKDGIQNRQLRESASKSSD